MIASRWPYFFLLSVFLLIVACVEQTPPLNESRKSKTSAVRVRLSALPNHVKSPADNPISDAKVDLGRLLFFDPILSGNKDVACATCHHPSSGYTETLDISIGVNGQGFGSRRAFRHPNDIPFTKRNAQSILNTAYNGIDIYGKYNPADAPMFWDLRVRSLESQAIEPIKALEEMRGRNFSEEEILPEILRRLQANATYKELFNSAFFEAQPVTIDNMAKAIAAYERTLIANNSRFDQYMRGDKNALSESEIQGFELFKEVGCPNCHNGPMFSDFKLHVVSAPPNEKLNIPDSGFQNTFAFRTPSLRNLRFTFPFMHNGKLGSVKKILEFYEDVSDGKSRNIHVVKDSLDPLVRSLDLTVKEMGPIINFLLCLNDENFDKEVPDRVPSGLQVGGNIGE